MPLTQNVFMKNVWWRVGKKSQGYRFVQSLQPSLDIFPANEYGLLLSWPKSLTFLLVGAHYGDKSSFGRGRQAFETTAREVGAQPPDPSYLEGKHLLAARVLRSDPIQIIFVVDTDDPVFLKFAQDAVTNGEKEVRVTIDLLAYAANSTEEGHIHLTLTPATAVKKYQGYIALDIGNTASTLVCLPTGIGQLPTRAIRVLDANDERPGTLKENVDPVVSNVRIDSADNFSDSPQSVRWVVGQMASAVTDGLVVGPKRLAAGKDWEDLQVFNSKQKVVLPRRAPAELLVCKMLQRFREATSEQPEALALTYPTTYEPRELNQLCEVVYRGFMRSMWRTQKGAKDADQIRSRIPVVIDEASAAAYFFLYQRILEAPGGLPRFRFLYPSGLNLLLYDCGGGTTDIALVNASSEAGSNKLVINVKARSGLRAFGGDNITAAVFRVLKAKLAFEMAKLLGSKELTANAIPDKPISGDELEKRLQESQPKFNRLIPTMFEHDVMDDENRQHRVNALDLWQWAESVKCKLEKENTATLEITTVGAGKGGRTLWDFLLGQFTADFSKEKQAKTALQVKINRWEVDCLIQNEILKSIKNCNELIRTRLTLDETRQEVHWVVASGNGARYPLIQELLKKRLDVQSIEDNRFTLDVANLKHAVAKGAVLYLMVRQSQKMLQVEFDTDLSNRLPFDVVYHDPVTNTYPVLFKEHDHYDKIAAEPPRRLELIGGSEILSPEVRTRRVALARRWPGEGETYSPYLLFEFEDEVQFPLEVSFNKEIKQFEVKDSSGAAGTPFEETDKRIYESPVQRGDL